MDTENLDLNLEDDAEAKAEQPKTRRIKLWLILCFFLAFGAAYATFDNTHQMLPGSTVSFRLTVRLGLSFMASLVTAIMFATVTIVVDVLLRTRRRLKERLEEPAVPISTEPGERDNEPDHYDL